ncbi:hypothetical protein HGM15179_005757 [Zosterops borbonicus]|uniref:Uncharacterized protein n=1 Tax=Zosterops borbonicus TaxID=364589 RepID=A0A8K1GLS9_9PASS|nr:hypothetical protein HGM15179_005757 [Zosterops borbonicus]
MGAGTGTGTGRPPRNAAQRRPPAASATGTGSSSTSITDTGGTGTGSTVGGSVTGGGTGGTGTRRLRRGAAPADTGGGPRPSIPPGQPTCPQLALDAPQRIPQLALGVLHQPCEFPNASQAPHS